VSIARAAPSFGPTARAWLPLGEVVRWGELGHAAEQLLVRARDFGDVDAVPSRPVASAWRASARASADGWVRLGQRAKRIAPVYITGRTRRPARALPRRGTGWADSS
jgi:hypothetical protein